MTISTAQIRELRQRTGAGILDAKNALVAASGDVDAAIQALREKGLAKAAKKATREASEGRIISYIHGDPGRIGVLLEVNCETDFVARTDAFQELCRALAMHVAAASPEWVGEGDVDAAALQAERDTYAKQMEGENKPPEIMDRILDGKLQKWMDGMVLMRQPYVRDNDMTVETFVKHAIADLGENIVIRRFSRFEVGEKV